MNATGAERVLDLTQPLYVHKSYRPATVLLPDKAVWHRCLVLITNQGLVIFRRRADVPHFFAPMDWAATVEPHRVPMHVGIDLHTEAGLVVVTQTGGCACGSSLRAWRPAWSSQVQAWPQPVGE